jgi:myosin heavy subunit
MSDEQKKQKKSRPKSEVVKSANVDGEKKKHSSRSKTTEDGGEVKKSHSKKSHSHHVKSEKPAVEDRSAEIEQLKKDLEAANEKTASLQEEITNLKNNQANKDEKSSSSSKDNDNGEEIANLKSQLEEKNNACREHESQIESLRNEISTLKSDHESALEAEFEKLATAQKEIRALQEKNEELQKPKPIQGTKVVGFATSSSPTVNPALSPRGQSAQGSIPAWKQREIEKQKEAEEARQAESRAKLQKVASLRVTKNDIHTESEHKNFRDPMDNKPSFHGGVVDSNRESADSVIVTDSISPALTAELSESERVEAEMARLGRTLKKGGHQL